MIRAMPRMPEPGPAVALMLFAVRLIVPATLLIALALLPIPDAVLLIVPAVLLTSVATPLIVVALVLIVPAVERIVLARLSLRSSEF